MNPGIDFILIIADSVTNGLSQCGYAFVEDDKVEAFAGTLKSFLQAARIPTHPEEAARTLFDRSRS